MGGGAYAYVRSACPVGAVVDGAVVRAAEIAQFIVDEVGVGELLAEVVVHVALRVFVGVWDGAILSQGPQWSFRFYGEAIGGDMLNV